MDNNNFKYAIVFAGQGAQKPGMGKSLYENSNAARAVFDQAGEEIKFDCFEADAERLKQTDVTQSAVYTMDMAAFAALMEDLGVTEGAFPEPSAVAGFSLGEYAAFTAAGIIENIETGLELVKNRSLFMKEAGTNPDGSQRGSMAAGMGSKEAVLELVEKTREDGILEAVNFNCPQQTVVAGDVIAVERFAKLAKENRNFGVKAIPLPVSGAFHSPLMRPASDRMKDALESYSFGTPKYTVYLNETGEPLEAYGSASDSDISDMSAKARTIMTQQMQSPVLWQKTIENMRDAGIDLIIEVGPGKTLTGLTKKIAPELTALHVEDKESLDNVIAFVKKII